MTIKEKIDNIREFGLISKDEHDYIHELLDKDVGEKVLPADTFFSDVIVCGKCPKCNEILAGNIKYCTQCGQKVYFKEGV